MYKNPAASRFYLNAGMTIFLLLLLMSVSSAGFALEIVETELPDVEIGASYNQQLTVTNGTTPYNWTVSAGALPGGLSLDTVTGLISGIPGELGSFSFTILVTDSGTNVASKEFSLTVFALLNITTEAFPFGETGRWYYKIPSLEGGVSPYTWSIVSGAIPTGLSFDSNYGRISQYPSATGTYDFTLQVEDSNGLIAQKGFSIVIYEPLAVESMQSYMNSFYYELGQTVNKPLNASGGLPPYNWEIVSGSLPEGLTFDPATATFSGTSSIKTGGRVRLQVTDAKGSYWAAYFSFYFCEPLTIKTASLPNGLSGTAYNAYLQGGGGASYYDWSIVSGKLPAGLTLGNYGKITGIPKETGRFNITVQLTDGHFTTVAPFTLFINHTSPNFGYSYGFLDYLISGQDYIIPSYASGGIPQYKFSTIAGALPGGMSLDVLSGNLTGVPTTPGKTFFTVQLEDNELSTASRTFPATVYPGNIEEMWSRTNNPWTTYDLVVDIDGNLFSVGPNSGTNKYNPEGEILNTWTDMKGTNITTDRLGNIIVASSNSRAPFGFTVSKYNNSGSLIWQSSHESLISNYQPLSNRLTTDANNNIYYFGYKSSNSLTLLKLDSSGNTIWEKTIEVPRSYSSYGIGNLNVSADGSLYLAHYDVLRKFDSYGNLLWSKTAPSRAIYYSVGISRDGQIYLSGENSKNGVSFTEKIDSNGNTLWSNDYKFGLSTFKSETVVDLNGNVFICHVTLQKPGYMQNGIFIIAFDSYGKKLGMRSYASSDYINNMTGQIEATNNGEFYVIFQTRSPRNDFIYKCRLKPFITESFLPSGIKGTFYHQFLDTMSGVPPYQWMLAEGALPPGLNLNSSTGEISGIPTVTGTFSFSIHVSDSKGAATTNVVKIIIADIACTDNDGDGYSLEDGTCGPIDCDDTNTSINPGEAETPYNGIDENCNGMLDDDDVDQDGYANNSDCNDIQVTVNPGATEIPYNGIDENCNGLADDNDVDTDGYKLIDDCNDNDPTSNPGATEIPYNGIDENCNGGADDDDLDQDGYAIAVDCNDNDPTINPGVSETPYNGIDENCNGLADDDDLDLDGFGIATDCNDNNPAIHPAAAETPYNGIDENCNGMADDTDFDLDGYEYLTDCNDHDPFINPGASEIPYNGIDENCNGMADDDDLDQDGFGIAEDCNDTEPAINPGATEIPYNGVDENCNGPADDDDLDQDGFMLAEDCNDYDITIYPGAPEVKHDGIDQDCNGYDLTIDVIKAAYNEGADSLSIEATSSLTGSAALQVDGYNLPMTWNANLSKWQATVKPAGGNPVTITVTGIEGSESATVTLLSQPTPPEPPQEPGQPTEPGPPAAPGPPQ